MNPFCSTLKLNDSSVTLLVTAHPDDEVMFFSPTLDQFSRESSASLHILCLSTGNFEGLGSTRVNELIKCAALFNISSNNVHIIDNIELQDGMENTWRCELIADIVNDYIEAVRPTRVSKLCFFPFNG